MGRNRSIIKAVLAILILTLIAWYGYFEARAFLRGPVLDIQEPENGSRVTSDIIDIKGTAHNISQITLNGRAIYITKEGVFNEKLVLMPGYNIITLEAANRFNKETRETLTLIYAPLTKRLPYMQNATSSATTSIQAATSSAESSSLLQ